MRKAISGHIVCSKPAWVLTKKPGQGETQNFQVKLHILRLAMWEETSQGPVPEGCELGPPTPAIVKHVKATALFYTEPETKPSSEDCLCSVRRGNFMMFSLVGRGQ